MRCSVKFAVQATAFLSLIVVTACMPVQFSADKKSEVVTPLSPTDPSDPGDSRNPTNPTPSPSPSPSPTPTVTPTPSPTPTRDVMKTTAVEAKSQKVDLILVVDDSNSMLADNQKLANKLASFVTTLQNSSIDWQMCATVTRALPITTTTSAWGASIYWQKNATASSSLGIVLKKDSGNLSDIFKYTINYINAGWVGSDDERGIKAAYHHAYNGDYHYSGSSGCYRRDAAIAYIIISDEDVRSIGGDASQQIYAGELKPLENEDQPQYFIDFIKSSFGANQRFTVNSIIVKPGDTACKASQDTGTAKSHYGFRYAELSTMTGGGIGSICDADFSANLNLFFQKITNSLSSIPLECVPIGNVSVSVSPAVGAISTSISGMNLIFATPISEGHTVTVSYKCAGDSRSPSSVVNPSLDMPSFFLRIVSFIKGLF